MRRIIIIIIVLTLTGVGIGAYFTFFANSATVVVAPGGDTSLPVAGQTAPNTIGGASGGEPVFSSSPNAPVTVLPRLVQVSAGPVVPGEVFVTVKAQNASSSPDVAVQYIEQGSGNVFSYLTRAGTITRINNKTIPGIQSATWLPNASLALVRYLSGADFSTINTYALAATSTGGFFLSQNLSDIAVSPTRVLTLSSGVNGSIGSVSNLDGSHPSTVFTTPLTSLRVSFAGKNQYLAFPKPSATLAGDAFLIDGTTGRFSRIAGPHNGLTALASPSGKDVLVSYVLDGVIQMELVHIATGAVSALPIAAIADKCVWAADDTSIYCGVPVSPSPSSLYPDDWYQGAVHFSDRLWRIDVNGRYTQMVLDFSQAGKGELDAEALAIDPLNTTLVFVNKNDGSLWSYSL